MNCKKLFVAGMSLSMAFMGFAAKNYLLTSPSGNISAKVDVDKIVTYSVDYNGRTVLSPSPVSMRLTNGQVWGENAKVSKAVRTKVDETVKSPLYISSEVRDNYNGLTLRMKGGWSLEFRAYNDGVAYRFINTNKKPFEIAQEQVEYVFPENYTATVPYVSRGTDGNWDSQYMNSFESAYATAKLSELNPKRLAFLPLSVNVGDGVSVAITETDLNNYPGLYLYNPDSDNSLNGNFAPYPSKREAGGYNNIQSVVKERAEYIARVEGPRSFPWRIAVIGNDITIASTDLSFLLAEPSKISDTSWIKPGKVAWDWWNNWNITGVDFRSGINTPTYKYYIDFASSHGIEYVILDDGWAVGRGEDLMKINPNIDLKGIVDYAKTKNVGIILWAGYLAFERDMEQVCRHYSEMGVKGFKVDFMDHDDQQMTEFNHRAAEVAARYHMVLDLHGSHKPAGINRTWPNVLNCEGVKGLEQTKWSTLEDFDMMQYDVQIPFLRQIAGPMDYTQGAMLNAVKSSYRPNYSEPMSQGTRVHQLALYPILVSPLNMLCDNPSNYMKEEECTKFIAKIPTVWDETVVLDGKMGEYVVIARRSGNNWYVGGITNWTSRDITVDFSKLGIKAPAKIELFTDGVNAHRNAKDYRREEKSFDASKAMKLHLAPGGGFAACITTK